MTTDPEKPPARKSNEATPEQLQVAKEQGQAYAKALEAMKKESGATMQRAGEYVVAFVQEEAEGMYALDDGQLVWREAPDEANAHFEIAVADATDGRFVPGLDIVLTLSQDGRELFTTEMPFLWHPFLYHYGRNAKVPSGGSFAVHVRIEPPAYMRHDPVNGKRFGAPVEVSFDNLSFSPGRKPSPNAQPRGDETPYASSS